MRGGGTAGPRGELDSERAGEPGEYHHSRNLIKKMAVGNKNLRESKIIRGECCSSSRNLFVMSRFPSKRASCLTLPSCQGLYQDDNL